MISAESQHLPPEASGRFPDLQLALGLARRPQGARRPSPCASRKYGTSYARSPRSAPSRSWTGDWCARAPSAARLANALVFSAAPNPSSAIEPRPRETAGRATPARHRSDALTSLSPSPPTVAFCITRAGHPVQAGVRVDPMVDPQLAAHHGEDACSPQ